ncbi:MAG: hypothetical protein A2057_16050 [Ignavibacteria bacterium GWA2_35_9]|nr:MAG: hypothetical protein A2057_16050 [Ignavibacteria bacterium GWA2_35_9]
MNLVNKLICLLFYCLLVTEVFPQGQSYISINGNINNSSLTRSIYNISAFTPLKKNNSAGVLDSLIYISTNGDRNRIVYNYNDDLSLNYFTNAVWYNGEWINFGKHTSTYNSDGNLESVLWEWFNSSSEEWFKDVKDIYNYDSLGNRVFSLHQNFNGQEFVNAYKYENDFKGTNLISSVQQHWIDDEWVNSSKTINTYTSGNLKESALYQEWINNQWTNSQISNYEYDGNYNTIAILTKIWQENQWIDYALGLFEYGDNNNLIIENWQMIVNNNRENWFRIFYEYDDNNNLIYLYGEEWKNGKWAPENELLKVTNPDGILYGYLAKEIFLYYSKPTSIGSEKNISDGFNLLQNYPNPFNPSTTIKYEITNPSFVTLKVFDILGREVKTLTNEQKPAGIYETTFDASNLSSGVYIYRITAFDGNKILFSQSKQMVLVK